MRVLIGGKLLQELPNPFEHPFEGTILPWIGNQVFLSYLHDILQWISTDGVMLAAHFAGIWGMICLFISITGSAKWMERGVKSSLLSLMLGLVPHGTV